MEECVSANDLPILKYEFLLEMWTRMTSSLKKVRDAGHNPFSCPCRRYAFNACLEPWADQTSEMVQMCLREVLLEIECRFLIRYLDYFGKLTTLARTKEYSQDPEIFSWEEKFEYFSVLA